MSDFRVVVNLSSFFHDHRCTARIFVKSNIETIKDLQDRISTIFDIKNFHLISQNHFLPPTEDVRVLENNELIWVVPNRENPSNTYLAAVHQTKESHKKIKSSKKLLYSDEDSQKTASPKEKESKTAKDVSIIEEHGEKRKRKYVENASEDNVTPKKKKKKKRYSEVSIETELNKDMKELTEYKKVGNKHRHKSEEEENTLKHKKRISPKQEPVKSSHKIKTKSLEKIEELKQKSKERLDLLKYQIKKIVPMDISDTSENMKIHTLLPVLHSHINSCNNSGRIQDNSTVSEVMSVSLNSDSLPGKEYLCRGNLKAYKKYTPPPTITDSYLKKKKINIVKIDIVKKGEVCINVTENSIPDSPQINNNTEENNLDSKNTIDDELSSSITNGYVKAVVDNIEKKLSSEAPLSENQELKGTETPLSDETFISGNNTRNSLDVEGKEHDSVLSPFKTVESLNSSSIYFNVSPPRKSIDCRSSNVDSIPISCKKSAGTELQSNNTCSISKNSEATSSVHNKKNIDYYEIPEKAQNFRTSDDGSATFDISVLQTSSNLEENKSIQVQKSSDASMFTDVREYSNNLDISSISKDLDQSSLDSRKLINIISDYRLAPSFSKKCPLKHIDSEYSKYEKTEQNISDLSESIPNKTSIQETSSNAHPEKLFFNTDLLSRNAIECTDLGKLKQSKEAATEVGNYLSDSMLIAESRTQEQPVPRETTFRQEISLDSLSESSSLMDNSIASENVESSTIDVASKTNDVASNTTKRKQYTGVGSLLSSLRDSDSVVSVESDCTPFITKRRRHRVRKRKNKKTSESFVNVDNISKPTPKPMLTKASPSIHIKFVDEESNRDDQRKLDKKYVLPEVDKLIKHNEDMLLKSNEALGDIVGAYLKPVLKTVAMTEELPKVNDLIEFKILRITENCTPQISSYITGMVSEITEDKKVSFKILNGLDQCTEAKSKFSINFENEQEPDNKVFRTYDWTDLVTPRKLLLHETVS